MCRPLPAGPPGIVAKPKRLTEAEIYVIICFLLFLGLLLLGVGLAYYCLKKRNIKIVRKRRAMSSAPASEITKLSGSTMGTLTAFDGFRIPRATAHSTSGSEAALLTHGDHSDTIPSDYPSESPSSMHSDVEEVDTRRDTTLVSETSTVLEDHYRYDNRAFVHDDALQRLEGTPTPPLQQPRPLSTIYEQEDYLTRTEDYDSSVLSARRLMQHHSLPPVYAKIRKKQQETVSTQQETTLSTAEELEEMTRMRFAPPPPVTAASIPDNDHRSTSEYEERPTTWPRPPMIPRVQTATMSETRSVSEYLEEISRREMPPQQRAPQYDELESAPRSVTSDIMEPPVLYRGPPGSTRHVLDDLYLTTITETKSEEDVTKHTRTTTQTYVKEPPPTWDVMIRTYPPENDLHRAPTVTTDSETDQWEQLSYVSERPQSLYDASEQMAPPPVPPEPPRNWDVLIRVLKPKAPSVVMDDGDDESVDDLSEGDRERWRRIITSDTTLRTMLEEAHTVEEFESIRKDQRYEKLFEPQKWDVIIRTLTGPPEPERAASDTSSTISETSASVASSYNGHSSGYAPPPRRYRKKNDQVDNRSRRSSLPPVYEYEDFDFGGTVTPTTRSRRTSRSSDYDLASGGEEEEDDDERFDGVENRPPAGGHGVDLRSGDADSVWSAESGGDVLGYLEARRPQGTRSIAERSTTEIVEDVSRVFDDGGHRPARDRRSLLRSSSELVEAPETMERDSHDERYREQYSERSDFRREEYFSSSARGASPTRPGANGHRALDRSSTEMIVNSPLLRMAGAASRSGENYSESEISGYMR